MNAVTSEIVMPLITADLLSRIKRASSHFNILRMEELQKLPENPYGIEIRKFGNAVAYKILRGSIRSKNRVEPFTKMELDSLESILDYFRSDRIKVQFPIPAEDFDQGMLQKFIQHGVVPVFQGVTLCGNPRIYTARATESMHVKEISRSQLDEYLDLFLRGNEIKEQDMGDVRVLETCEYKKEGMRFFIAECERASVAVGSMCVRDGICFLTSAATLPEFRRRGCQNALLKARFDAAAESGCDLVVVGTAFLSNSHKNLERFGMKIARISTLWADTKLNG